MYVLSPTTNIGQMDSGSRTRFAHSFSICFASRILLMKTACFSRSWAISSLKVAWRDPRFSSPSTVHGPHPHTLIIRPLILIFLFLAVFLFTPQYTHHVCLASAITMQWKEAWKEEKGGGGSSELQITQTRYYTFQHYTSPPCPSLHNGSVPNRSQGVCGRVQVGQCTYWVEEGGRDVKQGGMVQFEQAAFPKTEPIESQTLNRHGNAQVKPLERRVDKIKSNQNHTEKR